MCWKQIIKLIAVAWQVTQYNGKPQLIAKIHKAKECSFCLFDGRLKVLLASAAICLEQTIVWQHPKMQQYGQHGGHDTVQASNSPYQTSSETYTLEGRDPGIISALRSFGRLLNSSNLGGSNAYMKRIKDIRAGGFFDIICQVRCMMYKDLLVSIPYHNSA